MTEETGFNVMEPLDIGDLSDVQRVLIPPASNAKMRIRKVVNKPNKENTFRQLNVTAVLEDGVIVGGELKYKGAILFTRICYFADPTVYTKDYFKTRQYLFPLKLFLKAVEDDITNVKITDEYLASLTNKLVLANVLQIKDNLSGDMINTVGNFKPLPLDQRV